MKCFGSGFSTGTGAEHDVGGALTPSTSPNFRRAPRSAPRCRRPRVPQPSGSAPISGNEAVAATSPQPARTKSAPRTSGGLFANTNTCAVDRHAQPLRTAPTSAARRAPRMQGAPVESKRKRANLGPAHPKTKTARIAAGRFRFPVEPRGIEPLTSRVRLWRRSTNSRRCGEHCSAPHESPSRNLRNGWRLPYSRADPRSAHVGGPPC